MLAFMFLTIGLVFFWLINRAISTREIIGRGWGTSTRTYDRDNDPIWYWVTFISYLICAITATTVAVLIARKSFM